MLTNYFDTKLPKWIKILAVVIGYASVIYRVLMFVDSCIAKENGKKVQPLVVAIIECCLWPFFIVCMIVDLVHTCHNEKIHWLCDLEETTPNEAPSTSASTSTSTEGATEIEAKPVE